MIITGVLDITPVVDGTDGKDAVNYQITATPATVEYDGDNNNALVTTSVALTVNKIEGDSYSAFSGILDIFVNSGTKVYELSVTNGEATLNLMTMRSGQQFAVADFPLSLRLHAQGSSVILQRLSINATDVNNKGPKGDPGVSTPVYYVEPSASNISVRPDGSCVPSSVYLTTKVGVGNATPSVYEGGQLYRVARTSSGTETSSLLTRTSGVYNISTSMLSTMARLVKNNGASYRFELRINNAVVAVQGISFSFSGNQGPAGPKTTCRGLYSNTERYEFSDDYVDWVLKNVTASGGSVSEQAYIRKMSGDATTYCQGIEPGVTQGWTDYWEAIDSNEAAFFRSMLVAFISARDGSFDHLSAVDVEISGVLNATTGKFQNVFVNGCINNLITVIDYANSINTDLILEDGQGNLHLDVLRCGDFVWIKSLPTRMVGGRGSEKFINLPWFIDSATCWRGYTKYLTGVEHKMSSNEMRQLVGRKLSIMVDSAYTYTFLVGVKDFDPYGNDTSAIRRLANGQCVLNKSTGASHDYSLVPRMVHIECKHAVLVNPSNQAASNAYVWLGQSDYLAMSDDGLDWNQ